MAFSRDAPRVGQSLPNPYWTLAFFFAAAMPVSMAGKLSVSE